MKIKFLRLASSFFLIGTSFTNAAVTFTPADTDTIIKLGGYLNAGYHGQRGDYVDWKNQYRRQEARENLNYELNNPLATPSSIAAAKKTYQRIVGTSPYWEDRKTSLNDIYLRANIDIEQKINDEYTAFAFYERDFRTDDNDDSVRDAYAGISSFWGSFRFGRDESALTYVRDMIYTPEEKGGYEYQSFIEPLSVAGRKDNSIIYNFNRDRYGFELGYVIDNEEDFYNENAYSASAKYIVYDGVTLAVGYSGGKITADKKGTITQPNLNGHGFSSYDISQVFDNAIYNQEFDLTQKQFNIALGYEMNSFKFGVTWFKADYELEVKGDSATYVDNNTSLEYAIKGWQSAVKYNITDSVELSAMYTRAENDFNDFVVLNALTFGTKYNITPQFIFYGNVGANNSDASHSAFTNTGLRFNF
ncbi:Uncharacterised protein [Campylobacter jejuni]|nr:Uncharacterised protein [Campylobacter jejuni]